MKKGKFIFFTPEKHRLKFRLHKNKFARGYMYN